MQVQAGAEAALLLVVHGWERVQDWMRTRAVWECGLLQGGVTGMMVPSFQFWLRKKVTKVIER